MHRDSKCGNVILARSEDDGERAVVTDFGLAHGLPDTVRLEASSGWSLTGTPSYMAPEQLRQPNRRTPPCAIG